MSGLDGTWRIGTGGTHGVERVIRVTDGVPATIALGASGRSIPVRGRELRLVVDAAAWRHDIPSWRWLESDEPDGAWNMPAFDDGRWRMVPHLQPVISARAAAPSYFRAWVTVPRAQRGLPVTVLLGGLDGQDWSSFAVWLDGRPLDAWSASGSIREPRRILLPADDRRIRHDTPMLLAVRVEGLTRGHPDVAPGELEHHFFADWLLDQAVVCGEPDRVIVDFRVIAADAPDPSALTLRLSAAGAPGVEAEIAYRAEGSLVRKHVTIHNRTASPLTLLDVVTDDWSGDGLGATFGGRGQPVLLGDAFAGVEHPAGVARVAPDLVQLVEMPGVTLATDMSWRAAPVVLGGAGPEGPDAAFRDYVAGLRERPERRLTVYSALGWYDFTNPADPLPELTEALIAENVEQLAELAEAGYRPDIYMVDEWWDRTDLGRFRPQAYPGGATATRALIEGAGMRTGIWWATTRAAWSVRDRPGMASAVANEPGFGAPVDLAGGAWRWLEEFTNLMIGERRFCLAADAYREHAMASLPAVVGEVRAGLLKLDCAVLHCTSSEHGHRAGRHSVAVMIDALLAIVERCRDVSPDLRLVLYWGFRSPWFLRWADALFDKGLLMEAATVSSAPGRTMRQGLTTNVDQSIRHARFLPRRLQDSLGVWIGNVAWCNRIGVAEWQEAYLVDVARGADLVQLWGDLTLFGAADRAFLADVHAWLGAGAPVAEPRLVGGDPWRMEAYGYAVEREGRLVLTAVNPGPFEGEIRLDDGVVWTDGMELDRAWEVYPFPGRVERESASGRLAVPPFGVRVVEFARAAGVRRSAPASAVSDTAAPGDRLAPAIRPTRTLDVSAVPVVVARDGDGSCRWSGSIRLPDIGRGDEIHLVHRLELDGAWHYDPEPGALVRAELRLDGLAVHSETLPRVRDRNGPGSPWVLRIVPAGPAWSGRALELTLELDAPAGVHVHTSATLVDAWWRHRRRFRPETGR